uniref:Uncharacterized protein n=1 Tax=Avena sativa TaxID=4498 RepID=A0ACD5X6V1_AVESA
MDHPYLFAYKYTPSSQERINRRPSTSNLQVSNLKNSKKRVSNLGASAITSNRQTAMAWRKKSGSAESSSSSPGASPRHSNEREKVPRGHVPVVTVSGERVLVPVRLLSAPCIAELLDMAAEQYGYGQPGALRIPCDAAHFRQVVDCALHRAGC